MVQQILLALALTGAVVYVGRILYKSFQAKNSCATGCGKCELANKKPDFN